MTNHALFSSKDKSKLILIKCRLLQFLFGALRVNMQVENGKSSCPPYNSLFILMIFFL